MSLKKILLPIGIALMVLVVTSAFLPVKPADAWIGWGGLGWGGYGRYFDRPLLWNGVMPAWGGVYANPYLYGGGLNLGGGFNYPGIF